jgi:hypothetical protein
VARLGGITARSYQAVEAGRRAPGQRVLEGIIAALPLSAAEVSYLRRLAHAATCVAPPPGATGHKEAARAAAHLADGYAGAGFVTDHRYQVIAANEAVRRFAPGLLRDGNLLRWMFTDREAKRILPDWDTDAAAMLCEVRAAQAHHPRDIDWYETTMAAISTANLDVGRLWRQSLLQAADPPPVRTIRIRHPGGWIAERTLTRLHGRDSGLTVALLT